MRSTTLSTKIVMPKVAAAAASARAETIENITKSIAAGNLTEGLSGGRRTNVGSAGKHMGWDLGFLRDRRSLGSGEINHAESGAWRRPLSSVPIEVLPLRFDRPAVNRSFRVRMRVVWSPKDIRSGTEAGCKTQHQYANGDHGHSTAPSIFPDSRTFLF